MIFVVGGFSAGKRKFVLDEFGFTQEDVSDDFQTENPVFYGVESLDESELEEAFPLLCEKKVVIAQEIGCGVIPISKEQREHREMIGRFCCRLAQEAQEVYRLTAGIGRKIK